MAKQISSLNVALFATVAPFANGLKAGERAVTGLVGKVTELGGTLVRMSGVAALVGTALGSVFALGKGFSLASQFETANVQLTALTGSAQVGQVVLGQLRDFARTSPFAFPELLDASKKLIAVGVSAGSIQPLLKNIGDVAAGTGTDIGAIADVFARVANEGKLGSRELREFGRQGIPVVQELAKQFNTTQQGVADLAENGQIGFAQLQTAFQAMTGPGGRFNGILAAQSKTIGGVFHTLSATVEESAANIAESLLSAFDIKDVLPKITATIGGIGNIISSGVTTYAPYVIRFVTGAVYAFRTLYASVSPIISGITNVVQGAWGGLSALVTTYGSTIVAAAVGAFNQVLDFARPIWGAVYDTIAGNWQSILSIVAANAVAVFDVVSSAWTALVDVAYAVWGGLTGAWAAGWTAITGRTITGANETRTAFQSVIDVLSWLSTAATTVLGGISYAISNFSTLVQLVGTGVALRLVTMGNQFVYVFTGIIGPALKWAGEQVWDFARYTGTIFENLGSNIAAVFTNLPGIIKGSTKFGDIWKPLGDGFKAEAETWPGIADRQVGPLEKALSDQFDDLSDKFGSGLGEHLATNAQKAADIVKTTTSGIKSAIEPTTKPIAIDLPKIPKPDPIKLDASVNPQNLAVAITPEIKRGKAIRTGSAESLSAQVIPMQRILAAPIMQAAEPQHAAPAAPNSAAGQSQQQPPQIPFGIPQVQPPAVKVPPTTVNVPPAPTVPTPTVNVPPQPQAQPPTVAVNPRVFGPTLNIPAAPKVPAPVVNVPQPRVFGPPAPTINVSSVPPVPAPTVIVPPSATTVQVPPPVRPRPMTLPAGPRPIVPTMTVVPQVTPTIAAPAQITPRPAIPQMTILPPKIAPLTKTEPPTVSAPPTPSVPGVTALTGNAKGAEADHVEDWRQINEWGRRIEWNTRPLQTNSTQTVSI